MPKKKKKIIQKDKKKKKVIKKSKDISGLFLPGGLLIGIGIGFIFEQIVAGTLIGLGTGFIIMGIVKYLKK